jgi:hypothetical protein
LVDVDIYSSIIRDFGFGIKAILAKLYLIVLFTVCRRGFGGAI